MMQGWETHKLHLLVSRLTNGYVGQTKNIYLDEGVPYLLARHVKKNVLTFDGRTFVSDTFNYKNKKSILKEGDVLLVQSGHIGHSAVVPKKHEGHNCHAMIVITPKANYLSGKFLSLYFLSPVMQQKFESLKTGSTIKHLNCKVVREIEIPLPPLSEQKRIVEILDEAFATINKAKANVEKNLQNVKELFESYLQNVFANKGDGWEERRFEELCKLTRGHNPPKSKFINEPRDGYVRFYQIRDGWADDYVVYVPDTPQLHKVNPDEILMVAYRHIGKAFRGVSGAFNVALCKISNRNKNILDDDYLFYIIPTDIVKGELMKRSERSLIPSMSVDHLKGILIPLPSLKEQQSIVKAFDALKEETKKVEAIYKQKLNDLEELKKSILQKAFNGELTIVKELTTI